MIQIAYLAEERLSLACEKAPTDDEARLMEGVSECLMIVIWLVLTGTWLSDAFPYIGNNHHPIWRTHIFQRGRAQPPTKKIVYLLGRSTMIFTFHPTNKREASFYMITSYLCGVSNVRTSNLTSLPGRRSFCCSVKLTRPWPPTTNRSNRGSRGWIICTKKKHMGFF